jgi:hypothetical protein
MKGFLTRTEDGGVTATLTDKWGYVHVLTGTPAEMDGRKGYAVECRLTVVPEWLKVAGDDDGEA